MQRLKSARFHRLSREGFWLVAGQLGVVAGALVGMRLLTELLEPSQYGEVALGLTVATLVTQLVIAPVCNGVSRFYAPAEEQGQLGAYFQAVNRLVAITTVIVSLMILATVGILSITEREQWILIGFAAYVFAVFSGYNSLMSGIQSAARHRSVVAFHQTMEAWLRSLIAAGFLLWLGASSAIAVSGYAVAALVVLGSQYFYFRKLIAKDSPKTPHVDNWLSKFWEYSWPFSAWGVFTWAQLASDRWALELFGTTQEVGLYAVLFQLGYYPMSLITGMAMQFLAPIFYKLAGDARDNRRNANVAQLSWQVTGWALAFTVFAFLAASLFHKEIFHLFVSKEYSNVSFLLPWMIVAGGIFAAGQTIALNLMTQMKTQSMARAKIATALLGVVFNLVGAYLYGIAGLVLAAVLFSVVYFIWMVNLSRRSNRNVNRAV